MKYRERDYKSRPVLGTAKLALPVKASFDAPNI